MDRIIRNMEKSDAATARVNLILKDRAYLTLEEPYLYSPRLADFFSGSPVKAFYVSVELTESILRKLKEGYEPAVLSGGLFVRDIKYVREPHQINEILRRDGSCQIKLPDSFPGEVDIPVRIKEALEFIAQEVGAKSLSEAANLAICYVDALRWFREGRSGLFFSARLVSVRQNDGDVVEHRFPKSSVSHYYFRDSLRDLRPIPEPETVQKSRKKKRLSQKASSYPKP